jgi:hypothetical protein
VRRLRIESRARFSAGPRLCTLPLSAAPESPHDDMASHPPRQAGRAVAQRRGTLVAPNPATPELWGQAGRRATTHGVHRVCGRCRHTMSRARGGRAQSSPITFSSIDRQGFHRRRYRAVEELSRVAGGRGRRHEAGRRRGTDSRRRRACCMLSLAVSMPGLLLSSLRTRAEASAGPHRVRRCAVPEPSLSRTRYSRVGSGIGRRMPMARQ